ncbi:threonine/homoserine efflux transporter RhtA [Gillisia sp. Hel_I_86]|uniref:DMT family transporter n=1 Tax=Gillisia sp. Hel_I_86 TaxID=1249981 RepID=UPI001199FF82|nr:DMT family transporter [Gillisia sp. Hel_I_86]TVZ25268.1 threonine/homoserine efflux transporter RhtA [Gillisia sp. Hel_I_86]
MAKNLQFPKILELNLAVLFISTSGVLGRYITLNPFVTIFYRTLLAVILFYIFCRWKKLDLRISTGRDLLKIALSGLLMTGHWVAYFFALRYSNVAIGILSLFTYPVVTAFLEPLLLKTKFSKSHLALGLLVLCGIYFLVPEISFQNNYTVAVLLGILSGIFYALRNILMKQEIEKYHGSVLMMYQIAVVTVVLSPVLFFSNFDDVVLQWAPLLTLAIVTTCIGHTLFLISLRNFSATAASIMSSAQPLYAIILGIIFLAEYPSLKTIIGGTLIIGAVIIESMRSLRKKAAVEGID